MRRSHAKNDIVYTGDNTSLLLSEYCVPSHIHQITKWEETPAVIVEIVTLSRFNSLIVEWKYPLGNFEKKIDIYGKGS